MNGKGITRRDTFRVGTVLLGGSVFGGSATGVTGQEWPPVEEEEDDGGWPPSDDGLPDGPGPEEQPDQGTPLWPRLYRGTSTVELEYIDHQDRAASGEFEITVRLEDSEPLEQRDNPYMIRLETVEVLSGNFITQDPPQLGVVDVPEVDRTEGALTFDTGHRNSQYWSFDYDESTGEIQGTFNDDSDINELLGVFNGFNADTELYGFQIITRVGLEMRSAFSGNIGEDELTLIFDLMDKNLTVRCQAVVAADRIA
jgi:hypothetical protein